LRVLAEQLDGVVEDISRQAELTAVTGDYLVILFIVALVTPVKPRVSLDDALPMSRRGCSLVVARAPVVAELALALVIFLIVALVAPVDTLVIL
jgi:hypothetical protein